MNTPSSECQNQNIIFIFGWFKRSLNQSIGSFSCNPHFALLWSDQMSDILGNVSDHWGMVTYNFFQNIFFGSLIRTQELNLSCITVIFAFCVLLTYFEEVGHTTKCSHFYTINLFWANFFRTLIRAHTGSFANV